MSWEQLAAKREYTLPGVYSSQVPTFTVAQLQAAQELLTVAAKRAEERAKTEPEEKEEPVRVRKSGETAKPDAAKKIEAKKVEAKKK